MARICVNLGFNKRDYKTCKCKDRCDAWFPNNIQLREGCYGYCESKSYDLASAQEYTCSLDPEPFILAYGYDGCPYDSVTLETVGAARDDDGAEDSRRKTLFFIAAVLLIVLIAILTRK